MGQSKTEVRQVGCDVSRGVCSDTVGANHPDLRIGQDTDQFLDGIPLRDNLLRHQDADLGPHDSEKSVDTRRAIAAGYVWEYANPRVERREAIDDIARERLPGNDRNLDDFDLGKELGRERGQRLIEGLIDLIGKNANVTCKH
jgi:hypothetical protein